MSDDGEGYAIVGWCVLIALVAAVVLPVAYLVGKGIEMVVHEVQAEMDERRPAPTPTRPTPLPTPYCFWKNFGPHNSQVVCSPWSQH